MGLAVVRDLREARGVAGPEELAAFETDVLAGFVLARAAAGLADSTIAGDVFHLGQVRAWLGKPLREMQPAAADACFGQVLRSAARGTRLARAQALKTYFLFLELRHKVEIHQMTGHVVQCPVDELNRLRGGRDAALRIPPGEAQVGVLFAGWRADLAGCRKFGPAARSYTAARLMADAGGSARYASWTWPTSNGTWAGSGNSTSAWGKAPAGPAPGSGWSRSSTTPGRPWSGSCGTCGAASATITPGRERRCCPPRASTPTGPAPASATRRSGRRWPMLLPLTCRTGRERSRPTCCGTSAPASCTRTGRASARSRSFPGIPGSSPR